MNELLKNPFEAQTKKGQERTLKFCAWEVLKNYPKGLNVSQIAKEIQDRGLKDFSGKKNASGQVSGDLVRGRDVFWHDPHLKLWWIRPLAPIQQHDSNEALNNSLPRGTELVGHRVAVWWLGDQCYYEGVFKSYNPQMDTYSVDYDDGDADHCLKLRKYNVEYNGDKISVVTVSQHNLDDSDDETNGSSQEAEAEAEEEAEEEEEEEGDDDHDDHDDHDDLDVSKMTEREGTTVDSKLSDPLERKILKSLEEYKEKNKLLAPGTTKQIKSQEAKGDLMVSNQRKRRISTPKEDKMVLKKSKTEFKEIQPNRKETEAIFPESNVKNEVLVEPAEDSNHCLNDDHSRPQQQLHQKATNSYNNNTTNNNNNDDDALGESNKNQPPVGRLVQMIDILDLTRGLKPPEDKRPDTRNLMDDGELMSLSALSNELKSLDQAAVDMDDVTSAWRPAQTTEPKQEMQKMSHLETKQELKGQFLETVSLYKDPIHGNNEPRLLTSLGSNTSAPDSKETQQMDGLIPNRRDSILCSPPVLSRAPRL